MQDTFQRQILKALLIALRPLARALLRVGVGYREFAEISKTAFVDIATKDYGLRGRPTNISRVAVMTGLTRKEVRRIRDKAAAGDETLVLRSAPMAQILHRWFTELEFLADDGKPFDLPFDGAEVSFSALVKKYGGDIPPGAMRTELKRINAIDESADGKLRILKRNVSGLQSTDKIVSGLASQLYPAILTFANNSSVEEISDRWIQRSVTTSYVRGSDINRIRRISSDRLVEFTDSIDDLFAAYETLYDKETAAAPDRAVGIGVFYFEEKKSETDIFA